MIDYYQPRRIFETFQEHGRDWMIHVVTKSNKILDDADLLAEMKDQVQVEVSLVTLDTEHSKTFERGTPSPQSRLRIIEELSKDYVMTAMAKGADKRTIHYKHARRNALLPVVTVAGQLVAMSMEGSIAVEVVYNRHGIGWWLAESATQLDMPVLMCICLFMGLVFVATNLTLDILYAYIDPRIRLN